MHLSSRHLSPWRVALLVVVFVVSHWALADQKIKTKSNIKNDRVAGSSSAACIDQKEGSADSKTACKTEDSQSSADSAPAKAAEPVKP